MKYKCLLCGVEFESDDANPVCPVCGASGEDVVPVDLQENLKQEINILILQVLQKKKVMNKSLQSF